MPKYLNKYFAHVNNESSKMSIIKYFRFVKQKQDLRDPELIPSTAMIASANIKLHSPLRTCASCSITYAYNYWLWGHIVRSGKVRTILYIDVEKFRSMQNLTEELLCLAISLACIAKALPMAQAISLEKFLDYRSIRETFPPWKICKWFAKVFPQSILQELAFANVFLAKSWVSMVNNSYTMSTRSVPYMYTLSPRALGVHIR